MAFWGVCTLVSPKLPNQWDAVGFTKVPLHDPVLLLLLEASRAVGLGRPRLNWPWCPYVPCLNVPAGGGVTLGSDPGLFPLRGSSGKAFAPAAC